ncbi:DoxX family protein [Parapedobacter lycopersici]|uniref:DoxX family protein n=1 Tax=Parapedobacter lycopersici TaxID=1864939 RepID=UPI00333E2AF7
MAFSLEQTTVVSWNHREKVIFRFIFSYLMLQAVPLDWKYYQHVLSINWLQLQFADIFNISRYTPQFVHHIKSVDFWGLNTLLDWLFLVIIAGVLTWIWSWIAQKKGLKWNYDRLYYVLRVVLRYRLAIGVIAYGLIKVFPLQAPNPSLSNFNTNYGDLSAWKIFSLSLGIAPSFEVFLGSLEVLGGLLLLYRRTTAIGAFLILVFHGNVFLSNLAYEGGEAIYSLYLLQMAAFLLLHDIHRIILVFSLAKPAQPDNYRLVYAHAWQQKLRIGLKSAFVFFFVGLAGYKAYVVYTEGPYQYPETPGLTNARGLYNVREFRFNGREIPYDKKDTVRWQNVVFEEWSTLSIKTAAKIQPWHATSEVFHRDDRDRLYELAGTAGRHYYHYRIDTAARALHLENKNPHYAGDQFVLHYKRPDAHTLVVFGTTAAGDSVTAVLDRLDKKYLREELQRTGGRRGNELIL